MYFNDDDNTLIQLLERGRSLALCECLVKLTERRLVGVLEKETTKSQ